jgi:O-methyltransferase involved in polyketide biosynthesis
MKVILSNTEATLLLPLLARSLESQKPNPVFFDVLAVVLR